MKRPEHPNPQFERKTWENLNGQWQFETDYSLSGRERGLIEAQSLDSEITLPFCPESILSGIGQTDFISCVWYKRAVNISPEQLKGRIFLHIGACDYSAQVWINAQSAGTHKGGYASFSLEITTLLKPGENLITICAEDNVRSPLQPRGKQSETYASRVCDYTRTTGIWQTVWLEFTPREYIKDFKITPCAAAGSVEMSVKLAGAEDFSAKIYYQGSPMGEFSISNCCQSVNFSIKLNEIHLWELGQGRLYDVELQFGQDIVHTYFGLRDIALDQKGLMLNGRHIFQRLILDQGFYPDGIYTAPEDASFIKDIELALAAGFNGARLHQKAFEPRFLYYCDKMGYMVWGEYGNWGMDYSDMRALPNMLMEWLEILNRDYNHPSIIGWCPFNETWDYAWRRQDDDMIRTVYRTTKQFDSMRPCIDTSGNFHVQTDIFDVHDYEQNPEIFKERYDRLFKTGELFDKYSDRQIYTGEPVMVSEYGGTIIKRSDDKAWGYGQPAQDEEQFLKRYKGLTEALLSNPKMIGFCYTQLYDIEQEQNGLYTYDRKPKVDIEAVRRINIQKAAIED